MTDIQDPYNTRYIRMTWLESKQTMVITTTTNQSIGQSPKWELYADTSKWYDILVDTFSQDEVELALIELDKNDYATCAITKGSILPVYHLTTVEHYVKYAVLSKGIRTSKMRTLDQFWEAYIKDHALNSIPLKEFDNHLPNIGGDIARNKRSSKAFKTKDGVSLSDVTCSLKHVILHRVLGLKPIFLDHFSNVIDIDADLDKVTSIHNCEVVIDGGTY